jgi:hypothetical protein
VAEPRGAKFRTQFRFELGGVKYEYKGYLSAADAILIKQNTGLTALSLFQALPMGDAGAIVALVFLAKRQAGERVTWDEVVDQIDGDDDLWALLDTLEPINADEAPAQKVEPETVVAEEPAVA